ncbi:hypothetical protein O9G_005842 [Rozella allomycis CSF55]|uniref:Uncharacterized protein n=1 Tax=Rozella allomycis (strain CSF55) TaxID=988480 RepID=A0A075B2J0_ROZAC|nr:hypothetical protein O9G_005842 [Rozella allomycis CSF55]|eukprot:EPZ36767.1 hypothetical protein O9G_005842 [Rozella allomycis CSF55]
MQDRVSVILKEKLLIVANKVGRKGELEALGIHEHEHEHEHEEKKKEYRKNVMSNVKDLKENISTVLTIVVGAGVFIVVMVVVYVIWRNDKKMNTKRPPVIPFAMEMQGMKL